MSPRKIGALVAIQGSRTLQEYISTGIPLDADVSGELLINIFIPNTPLHDGAVIVTNDKIAVSCAYLPLTESTGISKEFGTRHRAAIGLSEVSDAFTFVISEETGGISITRNGSFRHDLSIEEFEQELRSFIKNFWRTYQMIPKRKIVYIVTSVFFSSLLFINATSVNFQNNSSARQVSSEAYTNTLTNIPIDVKYNDSKYFVSGISSEVTVFLKGSNRVALASEMQASTRKFKVVADLSDLKEGQHEITLNIEGLPSGLTATIEPQRVTAKIGKKMTKKFDVSVTIPDKQIAPGWSLSHVTFSEDEVSVTSDQDTLAKIDHVEAIFPEGDLLNNTYTATVSMKAVDSEGNDLPVIISPSELYMKVELKQTSSSSSSTSSSSHNSN